MSKFILRNAKGERNWQKCLVREHEGRSISSCRLASRGRIRIALAANTFLIFAVLAIFGGAYIYQVNSIATQGFAVKELEDQIRNLRKESEQLKIKEVELKSMYNIEKSAEELKLESVPGISYVEMRGPVAMK